MLVRNIINKIKLYLYKTLNKFSFLKKKIMYSDIEGTLNKKSKEFIGILHEFSNQNKLENGSENQFFGYLIFTSLYEFSLGNRKFILRFNNYLSTQITLIKVYYIVPSVETLTGFKEIELSISLIVDMEGDIHLDGNKILSHHLGNTFFHLIENKVFEL